MAWPFPDNVSLLNTPEPIFSVNDDLPHGLHSSSLQRTELSCVGATHPHPAELLPENEDSSNLRPVLSPSSSRVPGLKNCGARLADRASRRHLEVSLFKQGPEYQCFKATPLGPGGPAAPTTPRVKNDNDSNWATRLEGWKRRVVRCVAHRARSTAKLQQSAPQSAPSASSAAPPAPAAALPGVPQLPTDAVEVEDASDDEVLLVGCRSRSFRGAGQHHTAPEAASAAGPSVAPVGPEEAAQQAELLRERMDRRQRTLQGVKQEQWYRRYSVAISPFLREDHHPQTPKIEPTESVRAWKARVKEWVNAVKALDAEQQGFAAILQLQLAHGGDGEPRPEWDESPREHSATGGGVEGATGEWGAGEPAERVHEVFLNVDEAAVATLPEGLRSHPGMVQRQKQLLMVKNTDSYRRYADARPLGHPSTPIIDPRQPKRLFQDILSRWRIAIHMFDATEDAPDPATHHRHQWAAPAPPHGVPSALSAIWSQ